MHLKPPRGSQSGRALSALVFSRMTICRLIEMLPLCSSTETLSSEWVPLSGWSEIVEPFFAFLCQLCSLPLQNQVGRDKGSKIQLPRHASQLPLLQLMTWPFAYYIIVQSSRCHWVLCFCCNSFNGDFLIEFILIPLGILPNQKPKTGCLSSFLKTLCS